MTLLISLSSAMLLMSDLKKKNMENFLLGAEDTKKDRGLEKKLGCMFEDVDLIRKRCSHQHPACSLHMVFWQILQSFTESVISGVFARI